MMLVIYSGSLNYVLKLQIPHRALGSKHENLPNTHFVPWPLSQSWKYVNVINLKSDGKEPPLMYKVL